MEFTLPQTRPPEVLCKLAASLGGAPVRCAIGGYQARWNEREKPAAFWCVFWWCRRYPGLDVQDADQTAWRVLAATPGANWLTFLGDELLHAVEIDRAALTSPPLAFGVTTQLLERGVLIRAGTAPTLGDRNALTYPAAYLAVARWLAPYFVPTLPDYWGGFADESRTRAWLRRFVEPAGWS